MGADFPEGNSSNAQPDAIQRAIEYGVDISLLIENLMLTPTQRIQKMERTIAYLEEYRRVGLEDGSCI